MSQDLPDWLQQYAPPSSEVSGEESLAERHLQVLRSMLRRDYLQRADWGFALSDLARLACRGLEAETAFVALHDAEHQIWTAVTDDGESIDAETISAQGSLSVLKHVHTHGEPILTTHTRDLDVSSYSITDKQIVSVIAVPLYFWDVGASNPARSLGGCLYAHRTAARPPFSQDDVELAQDITRIAQPILNVLSKLRALQRDLTIQQETLVEMRKLAQSHFTLGDFESSDPLFGEHIIGTLQRASRAQTLNLLLMGPTGSGKTHLARCYHFVCPRQDHAFITLDCSQITSAETLAAELFGYAPNSGYANAPPRGRPGKAKLAHRGTLFIDEISALPPELQQKLLRLIQHGTYAPLGASSEEQVDIQIIAATLEDIPRLVSAGRFREDLYWRLSELVVTLPALDQRPADIPALSQTFFNRARQRFNRHDLSAIAPRTLRMLCRHPWSQHGNIRGLEHTINRAVLLAADDVTSLPPEALGFAPPATSAHTQREPTHTPTPTPTPTQEPASEEELRALLERLIPRYQGNVSAMLEAPELERAGFTELPLSTLNYWIRSLGLRALLQKHRTLNKGATYEQVVEAIREHGSGTAAARALGISRNALVWQLRKVGKSIGDVLDGDG